MSGTQNNGKCAPHAYFARVVSRSAAALAFLILVPSLAHAQRIENNVAVFAALDKVTAKIKKLEIPINEAIQFGALTLTPRVCYSRPPTERPKTTTFVEIDEQDLAGKTKRLFSGWMFAESPGLNALEHPVFDVWLTACKGPQKAPTQQQRVNSTEEPDGWRTEVPDERPLQLRRRRIRR